MTCGVPGTETLRPTRAFDHTPKAKVSVPCLTGLIRKSDRPRVRKVFEASISLRNPKTSHLASLSPALRGRARLATEAFRRGRPVDRAVVDRLLVDARKEAARRGQGQGARATGQSRRCDDERHGERTSGVGQVCREHDTGRRSV